MTNKRKLRFYYIVILFFGAAIALSLTLYALRQNINLFYTPSELLNATITPQQQIRIGGMVEAGSITRMSGLKVRFTVTDFKNHIVIEYEGILPDLFKEGQGLVALGKLNADRIFIAEQILAKHDQNYMPR